MADPITRTERRKLLTRANLLAACEQQISTAGLAGLSIQTTTELADVALGTFYNHFANKEELVEEVLTRDNQRMHGAIRALQDRARDDVERVAAVVATCVWRAVREPGWARFAAEFWSQGRWPTDDLHESQLVPALRSGLASGDFDVADGSLAIVGARDMVGGLLRQYADEDGAVADELLLRYAVGTVLRMFGASAQAIQDTTRWALEHPLTTAEFEEVA